MKKRRDRVRLHYLCTVCKAAHPKWFTPKWKIRNIKSCEYEWGCKKLDCPYKMEYSAPRQWTEFQSKYLACGLGVDKVLKARKVRRSRLKKE